MQSFLIIAKDKSKATSYISDFLKEKKVDPIDIALHVFEKAVGIEDVRNIQKKIILRPFRGKTKAVIIDAYTEITIQAQNALLKVLEEPPANTIIIISTAKKELFLPTIISRCAVIELEDAKVSLDTEDSLQLDEALNILLNGKIGDRLKIAQDVTKNKEDVVIWLEKMAIYLRLKLIENYNESKYLNLLKSLQKTYKDVESTNVNQRISLENLFLSF